MMKVEIHPLKKEMDDAKIRSFELTGTAKHAYSYDSWQPWTGKGYIKSHYDALMPSGKVVKHCWPNAGKLKNGGYSFDENSNVKVRLSASSPFLTDDPEI